MKQELQEYLRRLETGKPTEPGMYLKLFHGRDDPEKDMEEWGAEGPTFGPLAWCHITYLTTINLCAVGDDDGTGPMASKDDPMYFAYDMLYYDGMYYGDWELIAGGLS